MREGRCACSATMLPLSLSFALKDVNLGHLNKVTNPMVVFKSHP